MTFDGASTSKKVSIQKKYKRRVRALSRALDHYLQIAKAKLDQAQSGKIYNRAKIEHLVFKSIELAGMIAALEESASRIQLNDHAAKRQQNPPDSTENVLIDRDEFFTGLTQQEWDELKSAFNKRPD